MKIKALLLVLFLLPSITLAEITIHTASVHLVTRGVNNLNPGISYDNGDVRVGIFYNSHEKTALYATGIKDITPKFRVGYGVVSGYDLKHASTKYGIIPLIVAELDVTDSWSLVMLADAINIEYKF